MLTFSKELIRGPVAELVTRTPEEWGLADGAGRPFVFEITVRPPTKKWRTYEIREQKKLTPAAAAIQIKDEKKAAKVYNNMLDRTDSQRQAATQRRYEMIVFELLVSMRQVFADGSAEVSAEDIAEFFTAPAAGEDVAWCDAAAVGLEDLIPEVLEPLEKAGESVADAVARLIITTAGKAERQRTQIDEEEVITPLPYTSGSGHGSAPVPIRTRSTSPSGDSSSEGGADPVESTG